MRLHIVRCGIRRGELPDCELLHRLYGLEQDWRRRNFYCINGGTVVGGTAGSCTCTSATQDMKGRAARPRARAPSLRIQPRPETTEASTVSTVVPSEEPLGRARVQDVMQDTKVRAARPPATCSALNRLRQGPETDGTFYCINGGTVSGTTGSCVCTLCDAGYGGASCQTVGACGASTDPSATGSDGSFYCINGGSVGGTAGLCTCTSCNAGYEGASCQTASTCTALADSTKDGSDGTFYCINGGTIGAQRWIMHMHMQSHRVPHT